MLNAASCTSDFHPGTGRFTVDENLRAQHAACIVMKERQIIRKYLRVKDEQWKYQIYLMWQVSVVSMIDV